MGETTSLCLSCFFTSFYDSGHIGELPEGLRYCNVVLQLYFALQRARDCGNLPKKDARRGRNTCRGERLFALDSSQRVVSGRPSFPALGHALGGEKIIILPEAGGLSAE